MNIFKKFFSKKNKQEEFTKGFISYYKGIYDNIVESCKKGTMTYYSARGMFRHLPLRYDPNNTYPEEINKIVDKCFSTLYDYCIQKSIVAQDITFDEFYKGKGLYDESYPITNRYKRRLLTS